MKILNIERTYSKTAVNNESTQTLPSLLLIGCLSMLFAEVISGASQAWFFSGWGILITFPLYLAHVLFFLWIALKLKKTSLSQLYLFGMIFALYESWITKVLWSGYIDIGKPMSGTIFGLGLGEFPMLVFFWHPVMALILPILVFEILTGKILVGHNSILSKSTKKTTLIILFLIFVSTFIAIGNKFNLTSANISLIGTILIIVGLSHFAQKSSVKIFEFSKINFTIVTIYLTVLYVSGFFLLLPDRIPQSMIPYISTIIIYTILLYIIYRSKKVETELIILNENHYSSRDLFIFTLVTILSVNIACTLANLGSTIFVVTYFSLTLIGTIIFLTVIYKTLKNYV